MADSGFTITGWRGLWVLALLLLGLQVLTISGVGSVDAYYYFNDLETGDLFMLCHPHHLAYELVGKVWFEGWRLLGYGGRSALPLKLMSLFAAAGALLVFGKTLQLLFPRGALPYLLILLLGMSYLPWHYATEGEPVEFFLFFSCWIIYLLVRLYEQDEVRTRDAWLLGLATSLGVLFHQALVFAVAIVLVVLWRRAGPVSRTRLSLIYLAVTGMLVAIPYFVAGLLILEEFTPGKLLLWSSGYLDEFAGSYGGGHNFQPGVILRGVAGAFLGGSALKPYLYGQLPRDSGFLRALLPFAVLFTVLGAGLLALALRWRRLESSRREPLLVVLLFTAVFTAAAIYWEPVSRKFWAPMVPGLLLLVGAGWQALGSGRVRNAALATLALALLLGNLYGGILHKHGMRDTRQELSLRLQEIYRPGDLVVLKGNRLWQSLDYLFRDIRSLGVMIYANPAWAVADTTLSHAARALRETLWRGNTGYVSSEVRDDLLAALPEMMPEVMPEMGTESGMEIETANPQQSGPAHLVQTRLFSFADSEQMELVYDLYRLKLVPTE